jgi:hypothetical protein
MHNIIAGGFFLLSTCHTNRAESAGEVWLFFLHRKADCVACRVRCERGRTAKSAWGTRSAPQRALP